MEHFKNSGTGLKEKSDNFESASLTSQNYDEVSQLDEYSLRLQLKLLQKDLPEQVLTGWSEDTELFTSASVFLENALPWSARRELQFYWIGKIGRWSQPTKS